jgi:hypothetical protein
LSDDDADADAAVVADDFDDLDGMPLAHRDDMMSRIRCRLIH